MEDKKNVETKVQPLSDEELDQVNGGYKFTVKKYWCSKCQKEYKYRVCPVHKTDLAATTR